MSMLEGPLPDLLRRFPAFQTADVEEFRYALSSTFGATRAAVETTTGFEARASLVQLQDVGLVLGRSNSGVSIDFPETDYFRFVVGLTGGGTVKAGRGAIEINQRQCAVISRDEPLRCHIKDDHSWLLLRISSSAVERKLTSLLGRKPKGRLQFVPTTDRNHPRVQSLIRLVRYFAEQLDSTSAELSPLLAHELEQALTVGFLCANRHTFSEMLEREAKDIAPHQVCRAEEYIAANWNTPISIEDLVEVTGVSARNLFRSFVRTRGYTPMSFARRVRLEHARELLGAGNPEGSVTGIALQCGFGNLGHFANNYKKLFGELPSDTLAQARWSSPDL